MITLRYANVRVTIGRSEVTCQGVRTDPVAHGRFHADLLFSDVNCHLLSIDCSTPTAPGVRPQKWPRPAPLLLNEGVWTFIDYVPLLAIAGATRISPPLAVLRQRFWRQATYLRRPVRRFEGLAGGVALAPRRVTRQVMGQHIGLTACLMSRLVKSAWRFVVGRFSPNSCPR